MELQQEIRQRGFDDRMHHNIWTQASCSPCDVIVEVRLDGPHESLVARNHMSGEPALGTTLNQDEVLVLEAGVGVPDVDIGLSLVPEENATGIIGTEENSLDTFGLSSNFNNSTGSLTLLEGLGLDMVHLRGGEVGEVNVVPALSAYEYHVEDILGCSSASSGEDDTVSLSTEDIIDDYSSSSGISDVDERASIASIINDDVLQAGAGDDQVGEVDHLNNLIGLQVDADDLGTAPTDGLLQGINEPDVQNPEDIALANEDVNDGLEGIAVSFLLHRPARERRQVGLAPPRFHRELREREWHAMFIARQRNDGLVFIDLHAGGDDVPRNIAPARDVDALGAVAWENHVGSGEFVAQIGDAHVA